MLMFTFSGFCTQHLTQHLFECLFLHVHRLLEEESAKRAELEQIHLQQQRAISQTQAEKQELESERLAKEMALQAAMLQLESLEKERHGALEQYEVREQHPVCVSIWLLVGNMSPINTSLKVRCCWAIS